MQNQAKTRLLRLAAMVLLAVMLLTACASKAAKAQEKIDLGQKYLTELNYTEAVASFTEAIELDPENIPAYMGRAEAYIGLKQYDDAKADYTTAIEKTEEQPYQQAEAYIGRAEVNELTTANEDALSDYEAASTALDKVDVEKITDVTEQMLEALKIKVYNACARLSALLGRYDAAVAGYTKALESLAKLPDDADVLDVKAAKVTSYTGRAEANTKLENYADVLPDYDVLIDLGKDKTADRDTLLAAMSLAQSQAGDLAGADSWLDEVNHADYAESIQLTAAEDLLKNAAGLAKAEGADAYEKIKAALTTDAAKTAMQNLLARGYQLRYYDAEGKMLAVYAGATAWDDVNETENSTVTADDVAAVAAPTAEDVNAVSLSKLYVYYGAAEGRSREGEGLWYILNPGKTDLTAETYTWKNDAPDGGFQQKVEVKPVSYTLTRYEDNEGDPTKTSMTVTYQVGSNTVQVIYKEQVKDWYAPDDYDGTNYTQKQLFAMNPNAAETSSGKEVYTLSNPILSAKRVTLRNEQEWFDPNCLVVTVPAGTTVKASGDDVVEWAEAYQGSSVRVGLGQEDDPNYKYNADEAALSPNQWTYGYMYRGEALTVEKGCMYRLGGGMHEDTNYVRGGICFYGE